MYDYFCNACNTVIEDILLPYSQCDLPLDEPCPLCEATKSIERLPAAPAIGDAMRLGRTQLPSTWTDKLARIKQHNYKSTMHVPTPGKREI